MINPLQHLPVVGTIYRAITGEHIGPIEKIAGDTLYGGLWGAVTAIADVAFEAVTGKSVEDTVLAWFKGDGNTARRQRQGRRTATSPSTPVPSADIRRAVCRPRRRCRRRSPPAARYRGPDQRPDDAKGVDSDMASRALCCLSPLHGRARPQPVVRQPCN